MNSPAAGGVEQLTNLDGATEVTTRDYWQQKLVGDEAERGGGRAAREELWLFCNQGLKPLTTPIFRRLETIEFDEILKISLPPNGFGSAITEVYKTK